MPSSFGDVVLVPFPLTDKSATKQRPAVVVSSEVYHREHADVILMAVTSQLRPTSTTEVTITHWQKAGLLKPSVIKAAVTTLERRLVIRTLGRLDEEDRSALRSLLGVILGP